MTERSLSSAEYVRSLVEFAAKDARASAIRIHMERSGEFLEKASICDTWLRNGSKSLTADQIDILLEIIVVPGERRIVDPLETEVDRRNRAIYIRGLRAQLMLERGKRQ